MLGGFRGNCYFCVLHEKYYEMTIQTNTSHAYCVILAGGKGRRLWPVSREERPKQFLDFFGTGRTQLQQTFDRFAQIVPEDHIFVNTNVDYLELVHEQLPDLPDSHIMAEPIHRNTAPSVVWAAHRIYHFDPEACLIITPSDQAVFNEQAFSECVQEGLDFVSRHDALLTVGVRPTRPEPGYGYIQMGERADSDNIYKVKAFTEKPERDFAEMFVESGEWYWNTGLFLSHVRYLRDSLYDLLPSVLRHLENEKPDYTIEEEDAYVLKHFPSYPNLSLDYGILEKSDSVFVLEGRFGWADLGTWHGIYEATSHGAGDNVVIDSDVLFDDSHNNIVKMPRGHMAVIQGLDGYIVAEQGDTLLICKKDDSSSVIRRLANEVAIKANE